MIQYILGILTLCLSPTQDVRDAMERFERRLPTLKAQVQKAAGTKVPIEVDLHSLFFGDKSTVRSKAQLIDSRGATAFNSWVEKVYFTPLKTALADGGGKQLKKIIIRDSKGYTALRFITLKDGVLTMDLKSYANTHEADKRAKRIRFLLGTRKKPGKKSIQSKLTPVAQAALDRFKKRLPELQKKLEKVLGRKIQLDVDLPSLFGGDASSARTKSQHIDSRGATAFNGWVEKVFFAPLFQALKSGAPKDLNRIVVRDSKGHTHVRNITYVKGVLTLDLRSYANTHEVDKRARRIQSLWK